jgi:hypothetical protein
VARMNLPDPALVPVLRQSLEEAADFVVADIDANVVDVVPAEGAGATRSFLRAHRLCDANTQIAREVWAPLAEHPGYEGNPASRQRLLDEATRLAAIDSGPAMLQAIEAAIAGFTNEELPAWLEQQLP